MLMLIFSLCGVFLMGGFGTSGWWGGIFILLLFSFLWMIEGLSFGLTHGLYYCLNTTELSYGMILLSLWIMVLSLLASHSVLKSNNYVNLFGSMSFVLLMSLLFTFLMSDYLGFYVSFEVSLIPTLILILGWGYQPERVQAGMYMLFYTLFGSMPLLICLLSMGGEIGSYSYLLGGVESTNEWTFLDVCYLFSLSAFLMKLPMYIVHLWLPKAHVEAPVAGSMLLAGILLKLGGYGMLLVSGFYLSIWVSNSWLPVILGSVGGSYVGFLCLRQVDMKALVAYSSVAHMGLVLMGFIIFSWWGVNGGYAVMLGHGLCSSGLFYLVNLMYERSGSRSMSISSGGLSFLPSVTMWWFLLCTSNMAAPPSLNLLGEVSLIISGLGWSGLLGVPIFIVSFFGGAYSLYLYSASQHGKSPSFLFSAGSGSVCEYTVLFLHWVPLNILFMKSDMFLLSA